MEEAVVPALGKCAICGKAAVEAFRPFCSSRCATLDLGRWLGEGYSIPVVEGDAEDDFAVSDKNDEG